MSDKYLIPGAVLIAAVVVAGALIYTKVAPSQQTASLQPTPQNPTENNNNNLPPDNSGNNPPVQDQDSLASGIEAVTTFYEKKGKTEICKQDGKPVIYLFSTSWCPHCQWIKPTFDKVAKEYVAQGKIKAYHWELDENDDTLTEEKESQVPQEAQAIYKEFNPRGSIPTFVFGCKYYRIGNGHESAGTVEDEEKELRALIDYLISKG